MTYPFTRCSLCLGSLERVTWNYLRLHFMEFITLGGVGGDGLLAFWYLSLYSKIKRKKERRNKSNKEKKPSSSQICSPCAPLSPPTHPLLTGVQF